MQCPACHHENPAGAKFCSECGTKFERLCPACGGSNSSANKFCAQCGQALTSSPPSSREPRFTSPQEYTPPHLAQKILASRQAMERERKQVTVLFSDVSGFTSMAEKLDPEETHLVMERYFDLLLEQVHRYE